MILEALCRGNISPMEQIYPTDPDYKKETDAVCRLLEALSQKLSEEDYGIVKEILAHSGTAQCLEDEAYFRLGYALGVAVERETVATLSSISSG